MSRLVKSTLESEGTDEDRIRRFSEDMRADARRALSETDAASAEAGAASGAASDSADSEAASE